MVDTPGEKRVDLRKELFYLRKGAGITLTKLRACPALLDVLGASSAQDAYDGLVSALGELSGGVTVEALRNAFALGMDKPGILKKRRESFSATHENKHPDTI